MAAPYALRGADGFDRYGSGAMVQNHPWFVHSATSNGQISEGTGVFGGNSLEFSSGTTLAAATSFQFQSTSTFTRNNTGAAGKSVWGFNFWYNCRTIPTNTTANNVVTLTSSANVAQNIPVLGLINTTAAGLNLCFPSSVAGITTTPYLFSISTGDWRWISIKFALYPNAQLFASYFVDNQPIQSNVQLTFASDPIGTTNIANRLMFWGGGVLGTYGIDDLVVQTSGGADANYLGGFTSGVPNNPTSSTLPTVGPRRIELQPVTSNGSVNQWTPDDPELENYQAATESGHYVEALDSGLTDLYKVETTETALSDCIGVQWVFSTNKYLSLESAMKDNAEAEQVNAPGVQTKGSNRVITLAEQNSAGEAWTRALIEAAEFGQRSL